MRLAIVLLLLSVLLVFDSPARVDDAQSLVEDAVKAAGGRDKLPRMFRWKETWFLGDGDKPNPREAILNPPVAWYQNGTNIAAGNADRTEKTYLVWVWTLVPLLDEKSKLMLLPDSTVGGKPIRGVRLSREQQKEIDVYFDKESLQLSRIDWRTYQIDFDDWRELDGFRYPAKSFVRHKNGKLHLRTEFLVLERLSELPAGLKP